MKITIPKIKKIELKKQIIIQPYNFNKSLEKFRLPQLYDEGIIISLQPSNVPLGKLTDDGSMKLNIKYNAVYVLLINRYIEVQVTDQYGSENFIGRFYGFTVKGKGGSGKIRGCVVIRFENATIIVQAVGAGGNSLWQKTNEKIKQYLQKKAQ